MEIVPVETKKRIHEFSYAQKVSNQISPEKSHIKLNESLFKAQILEKQSCSLIKDIQKDLLNKIKKYDSLLKKNSEVQNKSNTQPSSPPIKQNQQEIQEVTQQQNQKKPIGKKLLTEIARQSSLNNLHQECLPAHKLDIKLSNFTKKNKLFSSQDISPIKQDQNISSIGIKRNNTLNTTPKQKQSSVKEFFGSYARLHISKSTSKKNDQIFESKQQVQSSKERKEIKKKDNQKVRSSNRKQNEITDYTFRPKQQDLEANKKNRIKKNIKQRQSIDLCLSTDLKEIIHIINDLDLFNNRLKKKQ